MFGPLVAAALLAAAPQAAARAGASLTIVESFTVAPAADGTAVRIAGPPDHVFHLRPSPGSGGPASTVPATLGPSGQVALPPLGRASPASPGADPTAAPIIGIDYE